MVVHSQRLFPPSRWGGPSLHMGISVSPPFWGGIFCHDAVFRMCSQKGLEPVSLYQLPPGTVGTGLQEGQGRRARMSAEDTHGGELENVARQHLSPPYAVPLGKRHLKFFSTGENSFSGISSDSRRVFW